MTSLRSSSGFSLLEVLVSVLILSFGLLGMAGLQLKSLQNSHSAYQRTLATVIAMDAGERLWANSASTAPLTTAELAQQWQEHWQSAEDGRLTLPGLAATITAPAVGETTYIIHINWDESRFSGSAETHFTYALDLYP